MENPWARRRSRKSGEAVNRCRPATWEACGNEPGGVFAAADSNLSCKSGTTAQVNRAAAARTSLVAVEKPRRPRSLGTAGIFLLIANTYVHVSWWMARSWAIQIRFVARPSPEVEPRCWAAWECNGPPMKAMLYWSGHCRNLRIPPTMPCQTDSGGRNRAHTNGKKYIDALIGLDSWIFSCQVAGKSGQRSKQTSEKKSSLLSVSSAVNPVTEHDFTFCSVVEVSNLLPAHHVELYSVMETGYIFGAR
jgi:hypothetical protein